MICDTKKSLNSNINESNVWDGINKHFSLKHKNKCDISIDPEVLNNFYINVASNNTCTNQDIRKPSELIVNSSFNLRPLTNVDLLKVWYKTKNPGSLCQDPLGLSNKIMKHALRSEDFLSSLTHIFNMFIKEGEVPAILKVSRVIPIPKAQNVTLPNETRPISLQPIITKIFDKCIYKQVNSYFETNNLFSSNQFGFRKNCSTTHALMSLTDYLH